MLRISTAWTERERKEVALKILKRLMKRTGTGTMPIVVSIHQVLEIIALVLDGPSEALEARRQSLLSRNQGDHQ